MHLVVVAQAVDPRDPLLGSFADWLLELAGRIERLTVYALRAQATGWPPHVQVRALSARDPWRRALEFYRYLGEVSAAAPVDAMFAHMCPEYVMLCAPFARSHRIPIILWYAHGATSLRLRFGARLSSMVVTSSTDGFRLNGRAVVIGQGINTDRFHPAEATSQRPRPWRLLSVGRLSPVKRYEHQLYALAHLIHRMGFQDVELWIAGGPARPDDERYVASLHRLVTLLRLDDHVRWLGEIPHADIPQLYRHCTLFVSSQIGSLDRATLEAMACGKPVVTSNPAFQSLLGDCVPSLFVDHEGIEPLSKRVVDVLRLSEAARTALGLTLRERVVRQHSLAQWGKRLQDVLVMVQGNAR